MSELVVAGGGLAGLVAARRLAGAGHDVTVYEERSELGGRVRSRDVSGFTCDRGFQVLFDSYPAVREELNLAALDMRRFSPGGVICRPGQRSTLSDPLREPTKLLESALNREISVTDKLRTLQLRRRLTSGDWPAFGIPDQSIRTFLQDEGFSSRFIEAFAAPLYGGITLDRSLGTFAHVFEYTFRAMSVGSIGVPADGMAAIPDQLAARAREGGVELQTGVAVESVETDGDTVTVDTTGDTRHPDAVVVATDPRTARALTDVETIPTEGRPVVTQHYRLPGPSLAADTRIMLNAESEGPDTVAQLSAVAPEYTSDDDVLLVASFVGEGPQDIEATDLHTRTQKTLAAWYPERGFDRLELLATDRIPFAQFAQPPGSHAKLPAAADPAGPVYLAGDYTRWSSIQGALESGKRAAEAAAVGLSD